MGNLFSGLKTSLGIISPLPKESDVITTIDVRNPSYVAEDRRLGPIHNSSPYLSPMGAHNIEISRCLIGGLMWPRCLTSTV
jgi:hypothetical protein